MIKDGPDTEGGIGKVTAAYITKSETHSFFMMNE